MKNDRQATLAFQRSNDVMTSPRQNLRWLSSLETLARGGEASRRPEDRAICRCTCSRPTCTRSSCSGGKQPVYENPENFFALTFPTHNLRNLVRDVVLRLAGKNDKAVRQLELTYGGGKTHTLITLLHLVHDPDNLPDLPAVHEFIQAIGQKPPKARVAGLCFDKLDVEKGMEVRSPDGKTAHGSSTPGACWPTRSPATTGSGAARRRQGRGARDAPRPRTLLTELLELPGKDGLGVL